MPSTNKIRFSDKCEILGDLWWAKNNDPDLPMHESWVDFFMWSDIGLPLAYMISQDFCKVTPDGKKYIEESYDALCEMMSVDKEEKFVSFDDMALKSPLLEKSGSEDGQ